MITAAILMLVGSVSYLGWYVSRIEKQLRAARHWRRIMENNLADIRSEMAKMARVHSDAWDALTKASGQHETQLASHAHQLKADSDRCDQYADVLTKHGDQLAQHAAMLIDLTTAPKPEPEKEKPADIGGRWSQVKIRASQGAGGALP